MKQLLVWTKTKISLKDRKQLFTIQNITLAGIMLALTIIIVKFVNFPLKVGIGGKGSMIIGFGFIPIVIFGFLNGPIFGLIFGIITDTTLFILHPGFYSPIMALQKPIVGFLSGLIGIVYLQISKTQFKIKSYLIFFSIMQILLAIFVGLGYHFIFVTDFYSFGEKSLKLFTNKWSIIYKIVFASFIALLLVIIETVLIIVLISGLKKKKQINNWGHFNYDKFDNYIIFILIVILQAMLTIINSWILTPLHYLFFYNVDYVISLLPRLVKELVLMPIRILIYFIVFKALFKIYNQRYKTLFTPQKN